MTKRKLVDGIAIDLVLLPDPRTMQMAIDANREITGGQWKIVLSLDTCLPHITLAMGAILAEAIGSLNLDVHTYFAKIPPLDLMISRIASEVIPTGETISEYQIARSPEILNLHQTAFSLLKEYALTSVRLTMLYQEPKPEKITLSWIRNWLHDYHKQPYLPPRASEAQFHPHITLGVGEYKKSLEHPIAFTADRIAICQLGNYCTCRKILAETKLREVS